MANSVQGHRDPSGKQSHLVLGLDSELGKADALLPWDLHNIGLKISASLNVHPGRVWIRVLRSAGMVEQARRDLLWPALLSVVHLVSTLMTALFNLSSTNCYA
eukprot:352433-Amphidinium_carterae.3